MSTEAPQAPASIGFCLYEPDTLRVVSSGFCAPDDVAKQARDGLLVAAVRVDRKTQRLAFDEAGNAVAVLIREAAPTLDALKADAKAALATKRWDIEIGGTDFNGIPLETDDRSKFLLTGAVLRAQTEPDFSTRWKLPDGTWRELDAAALRTMFGAVGDWVTACFAREAVLADMIDSAADADALAALQPVLAKFWP
jgi:Domain of unknown function (DUF4376)